ncbi:MAG: hypothetical protein JSR80_06930 [Verrucomicrobia bacterium]|nr:hypothetical protein [Verrucomicrobiota bacterium]
MHAQTFEVLGGCLYLPKGRSLRRAHALDPTPSLTGEERFADVALGWNEEGLHVRIDVENPYGQVNCENVHLGDAVELFIDTSDAKGELTPHCHHFTFLPGGVSNEVRFTTTTTERGYLLEIHLPTQVLRGYDPETSERIGFSYRISRGPLGAQHFCCCTSSEDLATKPSLWASLWLER